MSHNLRNLQARYDTLQQRLDQAERQYREEWAAFQDDSSLPLPSPTNVDNLQDAVARLRVLLDEYEDEDDEDAQNANVAPEQTTSWFGQGPAYSTSLRRTQTGKFHGGLPTTLPVNTAAGPGPSTAPTLTPATPRSSSTPAQQANISEAASRARMSSLLATRFGSTIPEVQVEELYGDGETAPSPGEQSRNETQATDMGNEGDNTSFAFGAQEPNLPGPSTYPGGSTSAATAPTIAAAERAGNTPFSFRYEGYNAAGPSTYPTTGATAPSVVGSPNLQALSTPSTMPGVPLLTSAVLNPAPHDPNKCDRCNDNSFRKCEAALEDELGRCKFCTTWNYACSKAPME